jgi:hypothetical protein
MIDKLSQYEDLKEFIMGDALGLGCYRKVGVFKPDPTLVIKCSLECPQENFFEMELWKFVQSTKILAKWFAPCIDVSPCGMFLLQKRVETKPKQDYPKMIPAFFTDTKYSNYGWLDGKFVCCDYAGFSNLLLHGNWNTKMKKANWWE